MSRPKKSNADMFSTHFDRDWQTQKSQIRQVRTERHNYSPTYSWDALSDDPRKFSKLQADQLPTQPCRPCTLAGNRVIELEYSTGLGVFNVPDRPVAKSELPLHPYQQDVGMVGTDLNGHIPMKEEAAQSGKVILMKKHYGFNNYTVRAPDFVAEEIPEFYKSAGPMADQKLLTPAERRKIMEFDAHKNVAHAHMQEAIGLRSKLKEKLNGPTHHRGVLMYDSTDNPESTVYAQKAREEEERKMRAQRIAANRKDILVQCGSSLSHNFGNLVPEQAKQYDILQSKKHVPGRLSYEQTQERVFQKAEIKTIPVERTQYLRERDMQGKTYNIVTGTHVEHWPSLEPHPSQTSMKNRILVHPSQTSLRLTRNMQGSMEIL